MGRLILLSLFLNSCIYSEKVINGKVYEVCRDECLSNHYTVEVIYDPRNGKSLINCKCVDAGDSNEI